MTKSILHTVEPSKSYYASVTGDGRLRAWQLASQTVEINQDIETSSGDFITCFAWSYPKGKASEGKHIAFGTKLGNVIIVDLATEEVEHSLSKHKGSVNSVAYSTDNNKLYTCSDDKKIIEWSTKTGAILKEWRGDKSKVQSMCVAGKKYLASAARGVSIWDQSNRQLLQSTLVHENLVYALKSSKSGQFIVSAAERERHIYVWLTNSIVVNEEDMTCNPICNLVLSSPSIFVDVAHTAVMKKYTYVLSINEEKNINIFQVPLTDKETAKQLEKKYSEMTNNKRIQSSCEIKLTNKDKKYVNIIAAFFTKDNVNEVQIVYGSELNPQFVTVSLVEDSGDSGSDEYDGLVLRSKINVKVDDSPASKISLETRASGMESATLSHSNNRVKISGPLDVSGAPSSDMSSELNVNGKGSNSSSSSSKNNNAGNDHEQQQISLRDQLKSYYINDDNAVDNDSAGGDRNGNSKYSSQKADTLAKLLVQALHSDDKQLLEDVLSNTNETVITNTVRYLPTPYVLTFLTKLVNNFQANPNKGLQLVPWLRAITNIHASYLMTVPDLVDSLGGLYQLVDSRLSVFKRLLKLNGRLDLILSQITIRMSLDEINGIDNGKLETYNEEDTDDSSDNEGYNDVDMMDYEDSDLEEVYSDADELRNNNASDDNSDYSDED